MLDKSIKHYGVIMVKSIGEAYPRFPLPEGYQFCRFADGDVNDWAEIEFSAGEFDEIQEALNYFHKEFGESRSDILKRCIFIEDSNGEKVATGMAWFGKLNGVELSRVHWISVKETHQNKGLCKGLISKILEIYDEISEEKDIYLTTQTWSYKAINIYKKFGFRAYDDRKIGMQEGSAGNYECDFEDAWMLINKKLSEYEKR